ncbi:MAG: hypothetical protein AAFX06_34315, partial [Planctomycetota bacterium]
RLVTETQAIGLDYLSTEIDARQCLALLFNTDSTRAERLDVTLDQPDEAIDGRRVFPHPPLVAKFVVTEIDGDVSQFIVVAQQLNTSSDAIGRRCRKRASERLVQLIRNIRQRFDLPIILGGDFHQEVASNVLAATNNADDLIITTTRDAASTSLVIGQNRQIEKIITTRDQQVVNIHGGETGVTRLETSLPEIDSRVAAENPVVFRIIMEQPDENTESEARGDENVPADVHVIRVPKGAKEIRIVFE